jgi:hypothetical protein
LHNRPTPIQYPKECTFPDSSVECIRGATNNAVALFMAATFFVTPFLAIVYISITMHMVYKTMSKIETQSFRYSFAAYRRQKSDMRRSRRVMIQSILYNLALFLTCIFNISNAIVGIFGGGSSYVLNIFAHTFWPLQGFFNALIYAIPKFQKMYEKRKERKLELEARNDDNITLSKIIYKSAVQSGVLPQKQSNMKKPISNNSSNSNDGSGKSIMFNNQHPPTHLNLKMIERQNQEFDDEEVKEEVQQYESGNTLFCPGRIYNHLHEDIESTLKFDGIGYCSSSDDCHGQELEELTEEESKYVLPRHSEIHISCESQESADDVDDYIVLAASRHGKDT